MVMDDNNYDVIDEIENLDDLLFENDGKINIDWYEEVNVCSFCINNEFLNEGFSTDDIFYVMLC